LSLANGASNSVVGPPQRLLARADKKSHTNRAGIAHNRGGFSRAERGLLGLLATATLSPSPPARHRIEAATPFSWNAAVPLLEGA
jgi:hypothetical protein